MATFVRRALQRRDDDDDGDDDYDDDQIFADQYEGEDSWDTWVYDEKTQIIKWVIAGVILLLFLGWIVGGYWHAKKRIEKGLRPLAYHRCFVSRRMMARVDPSYAYPPHVYYATYAPPPDGHHGQPGAYPMYSMPPPVYDPSRPPVYDGPPDGGFKTNPAQGHERRDDGPADYYAPPGPPPAR
ncbi:hypothetical protein FZEAL_10193 [Fusarium zealandicum]|uniref:Ubiquitin-protein ligase sel1 n=1 Tax=Fusarium zealandicum TaxID=1053134 RepID=A0A8H4U4Z9_9HYPO|nr:hypothetical protein FZEAL_10193 [Fusarium zealandicum]